MALTTTLKRRVAGLLTCTALFGLPGPATNAQIRAQIVVDQHVDLPIEVCAPRGDTSRIFITEQTGIIKIMNFSDGAVLYEPAFLDVSSLVNVAGERGMLGMAMHPDYASNGYFYLNYTDLNGDSVIQRFQAEQPYATSTRADRDSGTIILTVPRVVPNHNGGHLAFGPDGMLYISLGDGSAYQDQPLNNAQNINTLLGKILRVDVDRDDFPADPGRNYGIPPGNPFIGTDGADEIWAFGVRNTWRFSFDRETGDLWMADVGQDTREEINFQPALTAGNISAIAGRNYGWNCREGAAPATFGNTDCSRQGTFIDPVYDYINGPDPNPLEHGCAVMGGVVYRGSVLALQGAYLYSDLCSLWIHSFRYDGNSVSDVRDWTSQLSTPSGQILSIVGFGEDAAGEVYIISLQGKIYKIVSDDGDCGCPCVLTGPQGTLFADNFESDVGWTISSTTGQDGLWQRVVPADNPDDDFDPASDADGSGMCFVTGNAANADVDGGSVALLSPPLDFTTGQIAICFDYYLNLADQDSGDGLFIDVSSTGSAGPWKRVVSYTAGNGSNWTHAAITPALLAAAGIPNQANMRVRFIAADVGAASTVEAGVDNFRILSGTPFADCNANGIDDADDLASGDFDDCNLNGVPDDCDITDGILMDFDGGPVGIRSLGGSFFNATCAGCHGPNGTGATGPNLRNKGRATIKARLTYHIPHPGGSFPHLTGEDFANIEAFLADAGSRGRPDGIADECQTLRDCDGNGFSDGYELDHGTQVDLNYDGIPDECAPHCPLIHVAPQARSAVEGDEVVFSVEAEGDAPLTYRWSKDGDPLNNGGAISGATSDTLRLNPVGSDHFGKYSVRISNPCGTVNSEPVTLSQGSPLGTASGRRLRATSDRTGHIAVTYSSTTDRPVLLEKATPVSPWFVSAMDQTLNIHSASTDTLAWTDPATLHPFGAVLTPDGTYVFDTVSPDAADANLTARIPGALAIARSPTVFTAANGTVHIAGLTSGGELVMYFSTGQPQPNDWAFTNLSRSHLAPQGIQTPAFVGELTSYATPWDGRNIAGLDADGRIIGVWWSPGMPLWRADDISAITGTPPIHGPLSAFTTPWGGLNLAGTDDRGHLIVTWWVPVFGTTWKSSDLTALVGGPALQSDSLTTFVTPWGGENIAGIGPDGSVEVFWWAPGKDTWSVTNMTALIPGAEKPESGLTGVASEDGAMNIFGANSSGKVFRYHWRPGADWTAENISDAASTK